MERSAELQSVIAVERGFGDVFFTGGRVGDDAGDALVDADGDGVATETGLAWAVHEANEIKQAAFHMLPRGRMTRMVSVRPYRGGEPPRKTATQCGRFMPFKTRPLPRTRSDYRQRAWKGS